MAMKAKKVAPRKVIRDNSMWQFRPPDFSEPTDYGNLPGMRGNSLTGLVHSLKLRGMRDEQLDKDVEAVQAAEEGLYRLWKSARMEKRTLALVGLADLAANAVAILNFCAWQEPDTIKAWARQERTWPFVLLRETRGKRNALAVAAKQH